MTLSFRPSLDMTDLLPSTAAGHLVTLRGFGRVQPVCGVYLEGERIDVLEDAPRVSGRPTAFERLARQLADRAGLVWLDRTAAVAWTWEAHETPPRTLDEYLRLTALKFACIERDAVLEGLDTPPFAGREEEASSLRSAYLFSGGDPLGFEDWLAAFTSQHGAFCERHAALITHYRQAANAAPTGFEAQRAFESLYEAWQDRLRAAWDADKPRVAWADALPA